MSSRDFVGQQSDLAKDSSRFQFVDAAAVDQRERIFHGDHDPSDAGDDQRLRAGRRFALVAAWFERDIYGRAPKRSLVDLLQRDNLGVWAAKLLVPTLADDLAVADDHAADHRVGLDGTLAAGCEL